MGAPIDNEYWAKLNQAAAFMQQLSGGEVFITEGLLTWRRNCGFLLDPAFAKFVKEYEAHAHVPNYYWQIHTVAWAARSCLKVPGDFVELGVYKGYTTAIVAGYIDFAASGKDWYLYDTFEGIPEDQLNESWANAFYKGDDPDALHASVCALFEGYETIRVIRGRVPEILADEAPDTIAFMHVDLNSAKAERAGLEALYDRLSVGGMIVFDDYGWTACIEQKTAIDAFFAERDGHVLEIPTGQGLFVKAV